MTIVFNN